MEEVVEGGEDVDYPGDHLHPPQWSHRVVIELSGRPRQLEKKKPGRNGRRQVVSGAGYSAVLAGSLLDWSSHFTAGPEFENGACATTRRERGQGRENSAWMGASLVRPSVCAWWTYRSL